MPNDTTEEPIFLDGPSARIVAFTSNAGRSPIEAFLEQLFDRRPREFAKMQALLDRVKDVGPQNIRSPHAVKTVDEGLLEMKAGSVRIFWIYGATHDLPPSKRKVVLLCGVIKKSRKLKPKDIKRAKRLKAEYEERRKR